MLLVSSMFLFVYPAIIILGKLYFDFDRWVVKLAEGFFWCLLGFLSSYLLVSYIRRYGRIVSVGIVLVALITCSTGAIFELDLINFGTVSCVIFFLVGMLGYVISLMPKITFIVIDAGVIVLLIELLFANIVKEIKQFSGIFFSITVVFVVFSMMLTIRENLNTIFKERKVHFKGVQSQISKFSYIVMICLLLLIVILFYSKNILVFLMQTISMLVNKIIEVIIYLLKLLFRSKPGHYSNDYFGFDPYIASPDIYPIIIFIASIIIFFILFFTIYIISPLFIIAIKEKILHIYHTILSVNILKQAKTNEDNDYYDVIDILTKTESKDFDTKLNDGITLETILAIDDPVKKIRLFYQLLLSRLKLKGVKIDNYDTTWEIFSKSTSVCGKQNCFFELTNSYNEIRYGNKLPTSIEVEKTENNSLAFLEFLDSKQTKL